MIVSKDQSFEIGTLSTQRDLLFSARGRYQLATRMRSQLRHDI